MTFLLSLLFAVSAQQVPPGPDLPTWIQGEWGGTAADGATECGEHGVGYHPEGFYDDLMGYGTWEYVDGQLCQTMMLERRPSGSVPVYAPRDRTCRAVRPSGDTLQVMHDGEWRPLGRCPVAPLSDDELRRLRIAERLHVIDRRR